MNRTGSVKGVLGEANGQPYMTKWVQIPTPVSFFLRILITAFVLMLFAGPAAALTDAQAVKAIIGEAEGEPYKGKIAIGCALRNRAKHPYHKTRVMKGVFGFTRDISRAPAKASRDSEKAWQESAAQDITAGATLWGTAADVKKFKEHKWFLNCRETVKIGNHHFFKEIRRS